MFGILLYFILLYELNENFVQIVYIHIFWGIFERTNQIDRMSRVPGIFPKEYFCPFFLRWCWSFLLSPNSPFLPNPLKSEESSGTGTAMNESTFSRKRILRDSNIEILVSNWHLANLILFYANSFFWSQNKSILIDLNLHTEPYITKNWLKLG